MPDESFDSDRSSRAGRLIPCGRLELRVYWSPSCVNSASNMSNRSSPASKQLISFCRLRVRFAMPGPDRPEPLRSLRTMSEGLPIAAQLEWSLSDYKPDDPVVPGEVCDQIWLASLFGQMSMATKRPNSTAPISQVTARRCPT